MVIIRRTATGWKTRTDQPRVDFEFSLGRPAGGFAVECADHGDHDLVVYLAIPFLFAVWLCVWRFPAVHYLPGVRWTNGDYYTGHRQIRIDFHHGALWWHIWDHPDQYLSKHWRFGSFYPLDWLLGRAKYTESPRNATAAFLELPEGYYAIGAELYRATWRRPRWPFPQWVDRCEIVIPDGVPVPGKLGDDSIFSFATPAGKLGEALEALRADVLRSRGSDDWAPAGGWPAHCLTR